MKATSLGLLVPLFLFSACYGVSGRAPTGSNVALAGAHESCVETNRKRVHFGLAGLVPLHDSSIAAVPGTRARIQAETDIVDILLRGLGYTFTFGLYAGTQSVVVETCYAPPPGVAASSPMPPPPAAYAQPQDVRVTVPAVSIELGSSRAHHPQRAVARQQAYCSNSLDCGSGEFCKDRGDGMNVCMGKGAQGHYCNSGIDCASMSCKDPGDGFKVCMGRR